MDDAFSVPSRWLSFLDFVRFVVRISVRSRLILAISAATRAAAAIDTQSTAG
jgi:hypothetical protein